MSTGAGLNHFVDQAALTASIVEGTPATALCGSTFVVHTAGDGTGSTSRASLPFCPMCEGLMEFYKLLERQRQRVGGGDRD